MKLSAWKVHASCYVGNSRITKYSWSGTILYLSREEITNKVIGKAIELAAAESSDKDQAGRLIYLANELKSGGGWVQKDNVNFWVVQPDVIPS
jgi:hypothetical protein